MDGSGGGQHPGEDTRDIRSVALGNPEERTLEARTQRRGNRYLAGGFAALASTLILSLSVSIIYNDSPFPNPDAKIFGNLAFVTLMAFGGSLITVGWTERSQRDNRARQIVGNAIAYDRGGQAVLLLQRQIIEQREQHETGMQEQRSQQSETQDRLDVVMGMLATVVGRLDAIETVIETVPDYGRGVIDGIHVRADALGPEAP